jgi:hypothetical protein
MFSFTSEDKTADCTMNLDIKDCKKVENSDQQLSKNNTFVYISNYSALFRKKGTTTSRLILR